MTTRIFTLLLFVIAALCLLFQTGGNYSHAKQETSKTKKESGKADTAKKPEAGDITTRRSDKDKNLDKLKDKLYPEENINEKATVNNNSGAKKTSDTAPPKSPDNQTIVNNLINMKADEIETVKKNQLSKIRTDSALGKKEKAKLITETTKFYDTLKKLPPEQREAFVSNFKK